MLVSLDKVAVTGGISSGKTTVCRILEKRGAYAVSSDQIIHELIATNPDCIHQIIDLFGPQILTNEKIDRKKVAGKVFSDSNKLKALEELLHPRLFEEIEKRYQKVKKTKNYKFFVAETPLLQEINKQDDFDMIVVIDCDEALAKKRFLEKGFSLEDYEKRMQRQLTLQEKSKNADFVILNNGTYKELENQVSKFINFFI